MRSATIGFTRVARRAGTKQEIAATKSEEAGHDEVDERAEQLHFKQEVWSAVAKSTPPDGIAFGKSGNLYEELAGTSKISVLNPDGTEQTKYSGPAQNPGDPAHDPLPWANPANIAFNKKTKGLLVTNHASLTRLPDPSFLFAIFDVYLNDKAGKLFKDDDD